MAASRANSSVRLRASFQLRTPASATPIQLRSTLSKGRYSHKYWKNTGHAECFGDGAWNE